MVSTQYKKTLGAIINFEIGWNIHKEQDENCLLDKKQAYWCPPGVFRFMAYKGRLRPKVVPFSGFRLNKG